MRTKSRLTFVTILVGFVGLSSASAQPQLEALRADIRRFAQQVATVLRDLKSDGISIGQFTGPPTLSASGGPGIAKLLSEELAALQIQTHRRADYGFSGKYLLERSPEGKPVAIITGGITDELGRTIHVQAEHPRVQVEGVPALATLFGTTVQLPPDRPSMDREKLLLTSVQRPQVAIDDSLIKSNVGSPYAIRVLVFDGEISSERDPAELDYIARAAFDDGNQAFVSLERNEKYAIEIINNSPHDAAVTVTIDGLSMFTFADSGRPRQIIVPKDGRSTVYGWYRDNERSDAFEIMKYADCAAAELERDGTNIGTITVTFAAAWEPQEQPPADELQNRNRGGRGRGPVGTGLGDEIRRLYQHVDRKVGRIRDIISVRYSKEA